MADTLTNRQAKLLWDAEYGVRWPTYLAAFLEAQAMVEQGLLSVDHLHRIHTTNEGDRAMARHLGWVLADG